MLKIAFAILPQGVQTALDGRLGVIWRVQARPPLRLAALLAAPLRGSIWCIVICSMYRVSQKNAFSEPCCSSQSSSLHSYLGWMNLNIYSQDMNGGWRIGRSSTVLKVRFFGTLCRIVYLMHDMHRIYSFLKECMQEWELVKGCI